MSAVAALMPDEPGSEGSAQAAILAAAIATAVQAAMEYWITAEPPVPPGNPDRTAVTSIEDAERARTSVDPAAPANRLAYRVSEIQQVLGIGRNLVYELINSGQLGSVKAGKAELVPRSAVEKFLETEQ